jgi:hypothetical protein
VVRHALLKKIIHPDDFAKGSVADMATPARATEAGISRGIWYSLSVDVIPLAGARTSVADGR